MSDGRTLDDLSDEELEGFLVQIRDLRARLDALEVRVSALEADG